MQTRRLPDKTGGKQMVQGPSRPSLVMWPGRARQRPRRPAQQTPHSLRSYRPKALASLQLPVTSWTCALEGRPRQIRSHSSPPQGWGLSSNHPQSQGLIPMRLRWSHRHWHSGRKQAALGSRTEAIPKGEPRLREHRKLA